ncbi:Phospholipase D1 [Brachionus plicatilis]|uniref:phospholipase D n=1 Tax=Brachionus plicatilis TaxID=10195 RepID=A0A3M7QIP3_BRAPC|nr:Phospholipase D1 [Brachionus plicatilis]
MYSIRYNNWICVLRDDHFFVRVKVKFGFIFGKYPIFREKKKGWIWALLLELLTPVYVNKTIKNNHPNSKTYKNNEQVPLLESYPYLIPKSYTDNTKYNQKFIPKEELFKTSVQILRSVDDWSAGISKTETSILNAYVDLIKNAKHYIYIENQFFITTCHPNKDIIKNNIGKALADRIKIAHKNKQKFRVFIFLPLLPGFDRINAIKAVQYYNLRSIKFGEFSIYKELLKEGITDPSEYITFHGMRNWSVLMGKLVQEIIYVHSKLMIVDDNYVLCGSANINDRSLIGKRDSEVVALVTDEEFVDSVMSKKPFKAGKYALSLREKIFKLHLGVYFENPSQLNVVDCVSDEFYNMFKSISHQNTLVYDEVFKCLPSDNILNFDDLKNYTKKSSLSKTDPNEGYKIPIQI